MFNKVEFRAGAECLRPFKLRGTAGRCSSIPEAQRPVLNIVSDFETPR
jgi:hypothetical protein